jgi:2-polyprenyl-6-methoxyphenol hydroxylase-like FAD-dependent oxidoreductase
VNIVFKILIVGGGIAGLASAIALRGPDREIVVVEQSRLNKEIGALISLQPNASKIVEKWGLAPCLEKRGAMVDKGFRIYTTDGTLQKEILFDSKDYGGDRIVYHPVDLHETLKEAAVSADRSGPPVQKRTSGRVVSCDCEEGIITLENGETLKGDLIVGADGMYLPLRMFAYSAVTVYFGSMCSILHKNQFQLGSRVLSQFANTEIVAH